jgi:hypothetical protein
MISKYLEGMEQWTLNVTAAVALVVAIFSLGLFAWRRPSGEGSTRAAIGLFICFLTAFAIMVALVPVPYRSVIGLACVPAFLVVLHGVAVATSPGLRRGEKVGNDHVAAIADDIVADEVARRQPGSVALRLGLPAMLLFSVILGMGLLLIDARPRGVPGGEDLARLALPKEAWTGALWGGVGAYLYVLLALGRRTMRRDVMPGAIHWCTVSIIGGPILGAAIPTLWTMGTGTGNGGAGGDWSVALAPFAAGFSLRFVAEALETAIRRLFGTIEQGTSIPLTQIRGISRGVADRLSEEGIENAAMLAMTSPRRLCRNTPFDHRQVTSWIDEALLMYFCPNHWQRFLEAGVSGAVDLAWSGRLGEARITEMAEEVGMPPSVLRDSIARLSEDAQVLDVWALYQLESGRTSDATWRTWAVFQRVARDAGLGRAAGDRADSETVEIPLPSNADATTNPGPRTTPT